MHWDLYNDSHSSKFHILFSYQNNLNKYYYSKDLKRKPLIVLTLVYCVNFNLCPTFRLCLKRVKPRYICERYVFGCQLCVVGLLPDNHLWGSQSHRTRSPCQSLYRIKPVFVGSSFGMPKHLYPTAKVVTLYWFVPLLGRSCIEINNCWFKEIIASLKQSISTDSRRIYLKTMLFCFSQDIQLHIISIRNKDRFWRVNLALLLHCHGENILFLVFKQFSFFLLCVHHQYMMRLIWTHKYYVSSLTVKGNNVCLGFLGVLLAHLSKRLNCAFLLKICPLSVVVHSLNILHLIDFLDSLSQFKWKLSTKYYLWTAFKLSDWTVGSSSMEMIKK